jgi:hypothetical protein
MAQVRLLFIVVVGRVCSHRLSIVACHLRSHPEHHVAVVAEPLQPRLRILPLRLVKATIAADASTQSFPSFIILLVCFS